MTKARAFSIHLGISFAIFGLLAFLVVAVWYPGFFFRTDGGWQGLRLLLGVDLVLGPLLTLIVYRKDKPGLRMDLTMIGIVQASCLIAGVWIVRGERPLAVVYSDGAFYSVTAESFRESNVPVPDLSELPGAYPKWAAVELPTDFDEQGAIRGKMLGSGRLLSTLSERYVPFNPEDVDAKEASPLTEITDRDRDTKALVRWVADHGGSPDDYRFFHFGARYVYAYLGFDAKTGQFVGFLNTPAPL